MAELERHMKTKKQKKDERRYGSFWICLNCEGNPEFEHKDMMEHLKAAHAIDPATTKGNKVMQMHLDGDKWFQSTYDWTIGDLKFSQTTVTKRTGMDAMYWGR